MSENPSIIPAIPETVLPSTNAGPPDSRYKGYGGWLLVFCIIRLFIAPLFMLFYGIELIGAVSGLLDKGNGNVGYLPYVTFIGNFAVFIFGFVAALNLRKLRPGAVRFVKRYLIIRLAWSLGSLSFLYMDGGLSDECLRFVNGQVKDGLFYSVLVFLVWYNYFRHSKRVKATFPQE